MGRNPDRVDSFDVSGSAGGEIRPRRGTAATAAPVCLLLLVVVALSIGAIEHFNEDHQWIFALAVAVLFLARGVHLGRPLVAPHVVGFCLLVATSLVAQFAGYGGIGMLFLALSGLVLMWPTGSRPQPEMLPGVHELVDRTALDPLAPFAMHSFKSYFFAANDNAVLGYHTRLGVAVVSGDPIGSSNDFPALVAQFRHFCHSRGWRIAVLGASERYRNLWTESATAPAFRAVPIGRDVVIDVDRFDMSTPPFRNLRQAVNRTRNAAMTTEVILERDLPCELRSELIEIAEQSHGAKRRRGFSMILDHALDGRYPGMLIVLARDKDGVVQGFQRHAVAGGGTEISLDIPWRRKGAPNGIDERLSVAMVEYAREHGGKRVSLAFAAFPELFDDDNRGRVGQVLFRLIHLGDPLLSLESLYRYLKKFHALGDRRYVLVDFRMLPIAATALLTLEFLPRRTMTDRAST
ncbi:lysylphosphatidylglycerol synthetase-like protein (DUF2156 family) [Rhodococcus sp. 27YEA15]|uniref:bifunctional lysylphosphatidylglycerol flippase/synthetase MprF n=1 Tax=Rhodococcus sp. 27YEA15 TaxID=3156259 RepID=UPI003C79846A